MDRRSSAKWFNLRSLTFLPRGVAEAGAGPSVAAGYAAWVNIGRVVAATGVRTRTTAVAVLALALAIATACVVVVFLLEESLERGVTESARSTGRQVAIQ